MKRPEKYTKPPRIFTAGITSPDGTKLELIRDVRDGLAQLLRYDRENNKVTPSHCEAIGNIACLAMDEPEDWLRHVRLPLTATFGCKLSVLVERLCALFSPVGDDQALLLAAWVLSTWKAQELSAPPQLFVRGTAANTVLYALEAVCRRGIQLRAQSSTGTFPSMLAPTLLLRATSPQLAQKLLRNGAADQLLWRGRSLADPRTACAVAYDDDAKPLSGVLNIFAEVDLGASEEADAWQSDLLGWRLQGAAIVEAVNIADPVLRNLVSACSGEEELAQKVQQAYERCHDPIQIEVNLEEEEAVASSLSELAAEQRPSLYVAEIARLAERRLLARGSYLTMTPRHTGVVLRRLEIETERLGALGRGVRLTRENLARFKNLASKYAGTIQPESVTV